MEHVDRPGNIESMNKMEYDMYFNIKKSSLSNADLTENRWRSKVVTKE